MVMVALTVVAVRRGSVSIVVGARSNSSGVESQAIPGSSQPASQPASWETLMQLQRSSCEGPLPQKSTSGAGPPCCRSTRAPEHFAFTVPCPASAGIAITTTHVILM
eukprot:1900959-Pyramimonas_sp.AAC.1